LLVSFDRLRTRPFDKLRTLRLVIGLH
jgi:hypothetical protein